MPSRTPSRHVSVLAGVAALAVCSSTLALPAVLAPAVLSPAAAADPTARVLSSTTTNPNGGPVTTTFLAATVDTARDGWQGSTSSLPGTPQARPTATDVPGPMALDDRTVSTPSTAETPYQRFDLPWRGTGQRVVWSGHVDPARTLVLSAWDGTRWAELVRARGLGSDPLTVEADLSAQHSTAGTVHLLLHAEDPFADDIEHEVKPGLEDPWDYDFAIAHHTDTQHISRGSVTKTTAAERLLWKRGYTDTTQWIADNAKERKIAFAAHTGDLIEDWVKAANQNDPGLARAQFKEASDAQRILEAAGVVTATLPGNHDNLQGAESGPGAMFNEEFGPARYEALAQTDSWRAAGATYAPWRPGDNANSVTTFTAGGLDFVVVSLGFRVTDEEAAWADQVLKSYPDRNAIVLTHAYATASPSPDGRGAGFSDDGQKILERVIAPNPNVALVLAGHKAGVSIGVRKDAGRSGHHVLELMANYQYYRFRADELGIDVLGGYSPSSTHRLGASFLRLLQFDVDRSEVSVDTYSPYRNIFGASAHDVSNRYDGREDDTRLPVQLSSRSTSFSTDALLSVAPGSEEIGSVTAPSGGRAEVSWSALTSGATYGWRAVSTDATTGADLSGSSPVAWFVARPSADATAPRLRVPGATTLAHGATTFDPLQGVSARDDDGTDLTSRVVVTGRVDTARPGSQAISYMVSDAAGNTAVATRRIVVAKPPAPVNTGAPTITGRPEVGTVLEASRGDWTNLSEAEVRIQWLRNGSAISGATGVQYLVTPADVGKLLRVRVTVTAAGRQPVEVTSAASTVAKMKPKLTTSLAKKVSRKKKPLLKMRLSNDWTRVTGTVTVHLNGKKRTTLKLDGTGRAQWRLPKMKPGTKKVRVTYPATPTFSGLTKTLKIKVTKK